MTLNTQAIGNAFPHGFAGFYGRQPDMIVYTSPAGGNIPFGACLVYNSDGEAVLPTAASTAANFAGIAGAEIKSSLNYLDSAGFYAKGEAVPVFKRGCINVKVQRGTAAFGGAVYVRVAANQAYPNAVIGGIEATADGANTVPLPNCRFNGAADANGIAELCIMSLMQPGGASYVLPAATSSALGGVKQGAAVAEAAGANPTAAEFKALLDSLKNAGIIAGA